MKRERSKFYNVNLFNEPVDLRRRNVIARVKGILTKKNVNDIFGNKETGFIEVQKKKIK